MTRILSEILQAPEPFFRMQLRQLEQVSGHQNTDITLSVEVTQAVQQKIRRLGLDQHDTTSKELYQALLSRVGADDVRLERALRTLAATHVSAEAAVMDGMLHALNGDAKQVTCFALKSTALKRLLKKLPAKRVAKQLGYRSIDAMLRHEPATTLVAAALVLESAAWRRSWFEGYKSLKPADFENKPAAILCPNSDRWQTITQKIIDDRSTTVIGLPEAGSILVLPLPAKRPRGMVVASVVTALHELNVLAATSTYLQATQVQADFAGRVQAAANRAVFLDAPLLQQAMPWQLVQQYFSRVRSAVNEDVFGPYVQAVDFYWHNVEQRLSELCPSMDFWKDTPYLSFLENGKTVSLNVLDAAINSCNELAYEARATTEAQQALWHELTLRYLNRDSLEQAITSVLRPQLALETALNK